MHINSQDCSLRSLSDTRGQDLKKKTSLLLFSFEVIARSTKLAGIVKITGNVASSGNLVTE